MIGNAATVTTGPERSSSCRHIGPQSVPKVNLAPGDPVKAGDVAIIMESLKMELRIVSEIAGVVAAIHGKPGETVDRNAVVAMIEPQ